jgi:hypothetical protein
VIGRNVVLAAKTQYGGPIVMRFDDGRIGYPVD